MATRTHARVAVAQLLYAYGSGNDGISKFVEEILSEHKIKNAQNEFAKTLFNGVLEHLEEVDLRIKHQIKNWDFERIGDMERAILRLGAYEIIFSGMDKAIVINEALEITKNFSNETSTKFINGILDGIAKNATLSVDSIKEQEAHKQEINNLETENTPNSKGFEKPKRDFKKLESKNYKSSKTRSLKPLKDKKNSAKKG
ncbi:transcription antitermination factor NusB [Helicobacter winghamensis]|uniref:Transcription antitermination protein NusB n=1 Tax=Helicobacter winghamensis TaxID=157268 RepID=A0A2N3PJM1_9HELI|nr:transcription antitermination factor NusB [Helicobacter winghamensis]EEO26231.1 transcription antitermination factor NusB [Helicobacter winghamensis ATCC BAA-430]PKT77228.1 N utilization substance protein B [Helicobacter winghamensis]PKT77427.1 N utilization substance protein B [Helicobacter winghamensis]PKT77840.1 N utilization substance protein B [Helicobacter winghamensis]PKT81393.1 N utilization substance protein B [Helicobacter winghamensis]